MLPLLIVLGTLLLPALEIFVIIQVGAAIGAWPTVGLLVAETVLGAWLVRREGRRAYGALQETVRTGVLRDRELGDAALTMVGGLLLLFPGFVTDVFGLLLVLPFTRPVARRACRRSPRGGCAAGRARRDRVPARPGRRRVRPVRPGPRPRARGDPAGTGGPRRGHQRGRRHLLARLTVQASRTASRTPPASSAAAA